VNDRPEPLRGEVMQCDSGLHDVDLNEDVEEAVRCARGGKRNHVEHAGRAVHLLLDFA